MANTPIQIKRSLVSSAPVKLNIGEPAYSYSSNTLFIGSPDDNGSIIIGGYDSYLRGISSYTHANLGFNHANAALIRANNTINANTGGTITGDLTIQGNLNIIGGSIGANVPMVLIGDNIISLNTAISQSGQPTMNAGIEIDRGAQPNVYLLWNETVQRWQFSNDGSTYDDLGGSAASSYANSAFIKANSAYESQNATGQYANAAFIHANSAYQSQNATGQYANSAFIKANSAYESQNATGQYANAAFIHANSGFIKTNSSFNQANAAYQSQNATGNVANSAFFQANAAFISQNATGQYANAAFTLANGAFIHANSGFIQANAAYQSQNATGQYANAAFANANGAFAKANAAFANANGAFASANAAFNTGNSAFIQANSAFFHVNAAFANANGAFAKSNAAYDAANAAFIRANNSLNANVGGNVTGEVVIIGNLTSNTITTTGSNGSISGANAIFTNYIFAANGTVDLFIYANNAYANANGGFAKANAAFANANGAFAAANAAYIQANSAFIQSNAAFVHANSGFIHANAAYQSQNATGQYANSAFVHANSAYGSQNATGQYANSAFVHANSAFIHANSGYESQNATGQYANAAFIHANSAFIQTNSAFGHANAAYISQNATGQYANAAFVRANNSLDANNGGTVTGFINVTQNVSIGTYLDLATDQSNPTRVEGRVFYDNARHALAYYNETDMTFQIGQESVLRVWNNTGTTIAQGKPVYITNDSSANGFPSVALASAATANTAEFIGLTTSSIANTGYGYVTTLGKVNGLNTSLFTEGQEIFLSDTPGQYQTSPAASPSVPLVIGYVVISDVTDGSIYVHTHLMEGRNKTNGAILFARDGVIDQDPTTLYWDYANNSLGVGTATPQANLHVTGSGLFTGNVTISGNLNVTNANFISTSELTVTGNTIVMNNGATGIPTLNAEIIVNRGSSSNAYIRWDESINEWTLSEGDATNYHILTSGKTADTWDVYNSFDAYEKRSYPIGANLSKGIDYQANAAFATANIAEIVAISGFIQANAGFGHANAAYLSQNATGQYANSAFVHANSAFTYGNATANYANSAFIKANASFDHANAAFAAANNVFPQIQPSYDTANAAFIRANNSLNANVGGSGSNTGNSILTPPSGAGSGDSSGDGSGGFVVQSVSSNESRLLKSPSLKYFDLRNRINFNGSVEISGSVNLASTEGSFTKMDFKAFADGDITEIFDYDGDGITTTLIGPPMTGLTTAQSGVIDLPMMQGPIYYANIYNPISINMTNSYQYVIAQPYANSVVCFDSDTANTLLWSISSSLISYTEGLLGSAYVLNNNNVLCAVPSKSSTEKGKVIIIKRTNTKDFPITTLPQDGDCVYALPSEKSGEYYVIVDDTYTNGTKSKLLRVNSSNKVIKSWNNNNLLTHPKGLAVLQNGDLLVSE
jgi:hypothetical protein